MEDAGTEYLPALSKDALAEVALTDFFSLDFSRSVNHRRGVDGSDQRGQKQKARDNLQAIRILKTCVAENRAPSTEEQQKIALFYGFGGLPYSFRRPNGQITSGWSDVVLELEALTTDAELKSLRARTVDAQYTSDAVVSAIWDTVRQALPETLPNPQDPLQVLEPSVGSGVFLSLAPDVPMEFLAVEMDPITATVAKALHPREKIYNAPFQKVQFPETVDVVVGNPPFGKGKLLDMDRPDLTRVSPNTHGYFFAKSMDRLRPGGLAILVVSRYLMDADMPEHRAFRVWLHNQAELVSAVRLPHTVFSKTAFTDVVCDVVALRKRDHPLDVIYEPPTRKMVEDWTKARKKEIKEREERTARPEELIYPLPDHLPAWIRGKAIIAMGPNEKGDEGVEPVLGNPWYLEHPDHVLGELSIGWGKGLYRAGAPIVLPLPEFEDIGASLARVLKSDVQPGMLERLDRSVQTANPEYPVLSVEDMGRHTTPYSYFIVPETARKAALDIWEQIETKMPHPDGRIPAPVASRLFTTEDQPLIGMRFPDRVVYRTREKKTQWRLVTFASTKAANDIQRLTGMIGLRDTLLDLLNLQRTEERRQTPEMQSLRRKLRQDYDRFVKRYHHLHRPVNESLMRNDPSWAMLSGLEIEYTPEVSLDKSRKTGLPRSPEQVVLSEIFERRTQYPIQPVEHVDSAMDAMMVSLSESGNVDPARLQSLTGKSLTAIHKELKTGREDALVFIAPDGRWYERSQWLSGNIDEKIRMIRAAQERDGGDSWTWDIAMLEAHRPPRISILDRTIHIGAFWLPQDVVSDFVTHLGGIQPMIHKNPISGEWAIKCDGRPPEYSTDDMSLQDLLMALHNRRTIQVTRHIDNKTVVDAEATSLAVEKADRIKDVWRDWIYADSDRVRLMEDRYNDLMNTYLPRDYDGRHLNLPGSNPEIRLRPHQKNAVWRMTQSKSTLLDHVVGAGKTFAAIAGVMEKRRTGQSRKPLVTVPNHLVGQWAKDWLRLYPDARLLVADKEDMAGSNRQVFLAKAAFNDVDAVIVAHSSFDRIPIDAEFYEEYLNREIDQAEDFLRGKLSMEGLSVKRMEKKIQETRTRVERLHAQANESRDQGCLNFSEIGFDLLVVDESHNYKNVPYNTSLQNVRGLGNPAGSIKAENMMIKVAQCRDGGSGVVFLTGTPISNTVAEMYLLQKYMAPEKLEEKGIHTFDAWVSLFAEVQEEFAFTLTGSFKNLRTLATFDNLPELVGMYRDYADVINQKDIAQLLKEQRQHAIPMPKIKGGKAEIVVCPMTPAQRRIIGEEVGYREDTGEPEYAEGSILWRLDHLPSRPGPGEDNVLVIISDLRKAGLDARAFDPSYVPEDGEETGKLGICAENVKRVYDEWNEDRGTQLVYLDFSTPSKRNRQEQNALEKQLAKIVTGESPDATDKEKQAAESALEKLLEKYTNDEIQEARAQWMGGESATPSFVAYEALRNRMVALGIPRDEIAFIHDADTDEKKEELFDAVRSGKVRVMIGSTPKMGPGMNVQDRLVYVHHLDAPYRPTDVEQRNGRIIRQGNLLLKKYGKSFRVGIAYYVTENSSDAGLWQILETKKKFIDQVRYYDGKSNTVSDPDAQAIDPAAIKAQASGHEVLMLEVPLRARVKRLQALKNGYREEIHRAQGRAVTAREKMVELQGFVLPRAPEVAAQIRTLQETLKTGGSLAGGSLAGGNTAVDDSADILSIDKKEDPAFIPWGQGSHERMVTKKFLMDKFNKAMRELNGQSVSAHERVGFIGGFVVELEQLFTAGAMTIKLYPPDARHVHALHISSTKFDPEKNVNFFSRLENMLDASALETSIRNKEQEYRNAIRLGESDQVFGQENELQTLQQQHQLASRLLRLKVRKLDDLEERLTGVFLQNVKKTLQDVQETNPDTGETIMVSRLMHSREEERDARHQAKTFVQEMIEAFSRPPLTENALMVLEKLGVSAKKREALRESLGLSAEDAMSQAETENANAEEEEDEIEVVEEKPLTETAVDETVLKSRIGIRETVEAENPWLSTSAPFLPDLSAPGNGVQVSLFDDLFAPETPAQAAKPSTPSDRLPNDLPSADLPSADLQSADLQSVEMRVVKMHPAEAPSAREEVTAAQEIKTEAVMEDMEKSSVPAPSNAPRIEDAILDYITQSYDSVVYLAKQEPSEESLSRYGSWKEAVKSALRELTGADAAFAGYDTGTVDMGYLVHHFYLRHHAAPEISVATPMANRTPDATDHPIQSTPVPVLRTIPPTLREFLPQSQYMATEQGLRGEEREYFSDKMRELEQVIRNMPQTYQTEGQGDNAPVTLHYFRGNADWYIIEKDSDPDGEGQIQAFGLADLGMGEPELGYVNIQELVRAGVEMDYHFAPISLRALKQKLGMHVQDADPAPVTAPETAPEAAPEAVMTEASAPVMVVPESVAAIVSTDQRAMWESLWMEGDNSDREVLQMHLRRLDQWLRAPLPVTEAEKQRLDGRAGLVLRSETQSIHWFITGMNADRSTAYGLRIQGDDQATVGRVDPRVALQEAPILVIGHETGPLRADLRDAVILIESVEYKDDLRAIFWRGGQDGTLPRVQRIEDILDYERGTLENVDVRVNTNAMEYLRLPPVRTLQWVTTTEDAAREYGDPQMVVFTDPVVLARDDHGGVLVAEREMLEVAARPNMTPASVPTEPQARIQTIFYSSDQSPDKIGETVEQVLNHWNDSGIAAHADHPIVAPYLQMPARTGSLRVLYTQKPDGYPVAGWSAVEYKEPVILAELPDHAVLVAEQSYLNAYQATQNPDQNAATRAMDQLAEWITPAQMTALRNVMNDSNTDMPYTVRHLETLANMLHDQVQPGPRNLPIPTPKTAEILAGAGRGILTYHSPDSLRWWFITGMDQSSGHLYGLQMVRSRPDSQWEAQMGPVARKDLLDAGFLMDLAPVEPFVAADRMREIAPYLDGVEALPADLPASASSGETPDQKIVKQTVFDAGIPATGQTIGDLLGNLREHGLNLVAPSNVIDQYFYMERGKSVRVAYSHSIGRRVEPLQYDDPVTLATGPNGLILVAERAELEAYLALNPQRSEVSELPLSTTSIPEGLSSMANPEQINPIPPATASSWQKVEYTADSETHNLVVNANAAPFDGKPVLLHTVDGVVEGIWMPQKGRGENAEGFCWLMGSDDLYELDAVHFWNSLPDKVYPVTDLSNFLSYRNAEPLLIRVQEESAQPYWLEAWFDRELGVWQALDAKYTVAPDAVLDFAPLPLSPTPTPEEQAIKTQDPITTKAITDTAVEVMIQAEKAVLNAPQHSVDAVEFPDIPVSVARFMGDAQKTLLTTMLNGMDQNTKVMLSPNKIRDQLNRLDQWLAASATSIQYVQARGLDAIGEMALRMQNGDLIFMSALSEDGTSGYGLTLQTMTHRAALETLDLSIFDRDNWTVDLTHEPQPLRVTLADHGYSREAVTIERMTTNAIPASMPERGRIEKAGLSELSQEGPTYQSAIEAIESAGGWDAVADSPALQKSLQDQLDHLIQTRAEQVSQVLQEDGWKWSGAAFSKDDEGFKIFPNGRSSGGNMVHWGYRITRRDGDTPVAIDVDDEMTLTAQGLVASMLDQMQSPVAHTSAIPTEANPSTPDGEISPEIQNHLNILRPFVPESQFHAILGVLSGESGLEAAQSEASHIARLAQWIDHQGITYPDGRSGNGGHPLPDDAAVQGTSATCVLAYQNVSGTRKTYLTGMDDLGNLYGIRARINVIAGPVNLASLLKQGDTLNLTMQPLPVAELLKKDGYDPEAVTYEPAMTVIHEPYRNAIARTISGDRVQFVLNLAVSAMQEDWTGSIRKIQTVERALQNAIPDENLRMMTLENLKTAASAVEANRHAEAVHADLADPEEAPAPEIPATPLQQAMLLKIARSDYTTINGAVPQNASETETWADMVIETAEDKGVFTSLKNAELVWHSGEKKDAGVGLTEKGFALYQAIEAARSQTVETPKAEEAPMAKPLTTKPLLIGLSGVLGAGKDTVADMLVAQSGNAVKVGFGDILYREVSSAYGIPVEWLENRKMKDSPQSALSRAMCQNEEMQEVLKNKDYTAPLSPRYVLQQWGDYRRSQNPDYLIDHVREQVQSALDSGSSVAVSGMRTMPELTMIREMSGVTLRVRHPEVEQALERARVHGSAEANHYLENSLNDVPMDLEIVNDGTLDELQAKIPELYAQILKSLPASPSAALQAAALQAADLPSAGLSSATLPSAGLPSVGLPSVGLPSAGQSSARPFGLGDPIARAMLERIEASPYSLSYLLGDDRARDVDDPPYAEDAEWHAARVQFADEIDAVLNGRIRQNVDALGEHGWMQPVLHGDLIRGGVVIHLDTVQDADDNMQELIYRVSLAADTEGNETRTVRDYLRMSSAQFANELHGIAEQIRQKLEQDTRAYPEFTQKILDDYVVAHIHEHAPMVVQQAKANALEHFLLGNVLSATSNAILDAIEDNTLPRAVRDAAKAVLQGTEDMTDYRARIGRMVFDEEQSLRPGVPDVTVPADGPVSVVEIPLGRSVQPNDWLPMTDAQLGFRYRTENGVRELVFGTSRGDETILALHQDHMRLFHPVKNLQDPVMQRVILPLLADQLPEWETALHDAGVSLREIALPSDADITQRLALWKQKIGEAESPQSEYPVIPLENAGDAVTGVLTGFADEGKQLLLQQDDGSTIAVEQPAIDDWRMVGLFNAQEMDARDGDEERAIRALQETQTPITLRMVMNSGLMLGEVPVLQFAQNGQYRNQVFVHRLEEIKANWKAANAAYSWLTEYYEKDELAVIAREERKASISADNAKVSIRYLPSQDSTLSTEVSLHFTGKKDQVRAVLKDAGGSFVWGHSQDLEKRGDMPLLIGTVEALRSESLKQQEVLKKQEPLVQTYLDSYAQAAERINAAINAVDRSLITDEQSARTIYQEVDKAVREGQGLIESAADALRKVSENGQIPVPVNDRLGRYAPASQHREALMAVRTLNTELMQIVKDHLMEKGRDFLATANENTPIEEIAVAIFNKHGHNTTRTPDMVKYVQDHDLRQIQNTIGHNSMNSASQEIFEWMTGVQLGKTQKVRVRQIDAWAAVTPEMRARMDAEAKEQREEQQNIKDLRSIWESFAGMRMQRGGNGQDYILAMVKNGHTQVSSHKNGASVQYGLLNPEDHGVVYMTRNREFNRFCKTILKMGGDGGIMNALQKAELINGIQPPMPEPEPESDTEIEHLFSGAQSGPAAEAEPENAAATILPDLAPAMDESPSGAALQSAAIQLADLQATDSTSTDLPEADLPSAGQTSSDLLPDPKEEDVAEEDDDEEDPDLAPVAATEKPELPGWKVGQPDMLSPLWDMQIPFTWPNEHGTFPAGYSADWSFGKGYLENVTIEIARDPQGKYHFSTHGSVGGYAPNVNGPIFATFLEAHTAAREELAEKLRRKYAESTAERGFVKGAPKLLEGITQRADGDRHSIAKTDDLLREPPYQQAFGEILERLEGDQRMILTWGYRNDRNFNNWMVTLHQDDEEQSVMAELRTYGDWDFTQPPEFAQAVDLDNLDAWSNFLRQIAGRFPEKDRDALSLAPYGLHYEPIWHIAGPIPSERVSHLPPAPHWPEDVNDELPVEAPGELKNFNRFVGLRFESESENQKQYVALFIARDKQGYVPAIGFQSKGVFGPSVPNARDTHYPSFVQAYEQGRKMLGKHIKEHANLNWTTDADRAAKDWLDKKPEAAEPIFFGYDTARMETLWDRQDRLHNAIAVQIKHRKASSSIVADEIDRYSLEAVIVGKSDTRYLSSASSLERAMLMVNSAYALMQHQASQALDAKLEQPEALHRAETVVSHLKEEFGDLLTVAPEEKSPLRQQVESLLEDIEHKLEDVKRKEATAQSGSSLGQIMADKLSSLAAAQKLDALFGSDEALGVRFVDHEGHEIPMTEDADGQSVFPDGSSATICTDYAEQIRKKLEGHEVQIVGFANENNPDCAVVREAWHPGGHDFAIVDHRWLIDPWARLVGAYREQIVYDLRDPEDTRKVAEIYGDPLKWDRSGTYSIGHASSLTQWDRSGLEGVIEVVEANERKAAGITITEAAIIPTRAGVVAVPTDPNLPVYHAGQSETPVESPSAGTETTDESWLSEIPEAYRMTVRAVATPFMELSAQVKYAELTAVRAGHRMLNMELEGPEFWRNGQILLHAKIDDDTHHVVEREWSLSISREVMNNVQLYFMFTQIRDRGLLDDLRSVDRIKADYGPVLMNGVLGRTEIAEIMACHGLQPLRLLLTVEPDGMPNETLNRLTNHLMDRLRGWRTDFQNTPVVIDILSIQGFPETMMDRLRMVAESVDRADTAHPESLVRRADLTAQIGMTCDAVASILGHNFRSQQYRDLVKPLLIYQPDIIEVRLEKMLPDVLNTLYQRNETNHRQMDLQGLVPLSKTLDAIALQVPETQTQPQKVEVSAQPEDPRQFQASILDEAPAESTGTEMPSAGQDADWQRLKDLPVTLPEIMDASVDQQPLLDRLARRGIPLGLLQEPSSVNYVTEILKSGDLAGAGAQAWFVRRNDLVAQDAELRELRFYNGDPEQRHVFLLVGNRFLFDPWMAMSKPGEPYALDIQNPADRDILIDRYLSPAFWISPHPAAVLSPAWRELERWNPDLQAFTDDSDDEMETPVELRETIILPAETITPSAETIAPLPETVATEPEKVPDVPVPTPSIAGQGNPIAASPDPAGVQPHVGSSLAGDSPAGDSPAGSILAVRSTAVRSTAVRETAAPKVQEVLMDWKSLSETPEILPELAVYLRGLAEHPERLPESGRFWAQSVPQEVLREMLVSLSAEWDREYWKMIVDFLVKSLGGDPFVSRVDLLQHGTAKDAITGLSFLLMHLSASEAHWPGQELSVLDRDAFLKSLEKLPQAQGTPQEAATAPLPRSGEIGPDDRIVEIRIIPLDAAEQDWKVQNGQEPARWKLTAILQDGWEIPKVLKAGVTYAQALQAARDRTEKWGARLVDVYADARAGTIQNKPADDLRLEKGEFLDDSIKISSEEYVPGEDAPVNNPVSMTSWPASVPPSNWSSSNTAVPPSDTSPSLNTGLPSAGQTPTTNIWPAAVPPAASLQAASPSAASPVETREKPGFDIPQSIWKQEVTQPMNAEEQRVMEQVNAFLKDPGNIDETTKRQWIGQAIVVRNKTLEMMQPYFRRDPVLAAQWQQSDLLLDMVRKTMTINRENIAEIMQSPGNGVRRMLLQHLPVEPTLDAIRGWVLENAMTQMVTQTMNMDPFHSMMQVIRDRDFKFPHHALVDLSPPLVLFGPDRSARIILMRTPRSIPHMDSKDAITQIHACKSWVKSILDDKFDKEHLTIQMHIAYFDASRQNVLIRDVTEIPGQTDAVRKQAETVAKMVETKQVPKELPRVVNKVALTPEITRDVQEIARLEAMKQTLETQIQKMEQDLQSRMGGDPEAWPKIPQEVSMGSIRTEWSSRILDDKAMNALSTLGIPRSQVEKPEYDVDAMLRAMNNAGIATGQFITGHQLDTDRLNAVLQAYDVPRSTYQPARPVVTPNEKHPAYQQAVQTLQVNAPANSPAPTEEFTP